MPKILRGERLRNLGPMAELRSRGQTAHSLENVLDSVQAMSLLTIMEIIGPVLLLAVLIYGTVQWSRRRWADASSPRGIHTSALSGGRQSGKAGSHCSAKPRLRIVVIRARYLLAVPVET
jgi:hypothetical protein